MAKYTYHLSRPLKFRNLKPKQTPKMATEMQNLFRKIGNGETAAPVVAPPLPFHPNIPSAQDPVIDPATRYQMEKLHGIHLVKVVPTTPHPEDAEGWWVDAMDYKLYQLSTTPAARHWRVRHSLVGMHHTDSLKYMEYSKCLICREAGKNLTVLVVSDDQSLREASGEEPPVSSKAGTSNGNQ